MYVKLVAKFTRPDFEEIVRGCEEIFRGDATIIMGR